MMGNRITVTAEDGFSLSAYRADPAGIPRGGILVIQEIFGVNPHIKSVADRFASEGYVAIAPALFDRTEPNVALGYTQPDILRGRDLRGRLQLESVLQDLRAAIGAVREFGRVGAVGYCWGGSLAWLSATRLTVPAVCYYGAMIIDCVEESLSVPVMLHFGDHDASIPMDTVDHIRQAHPSISIHVYQAAHGFNCDARVDFHQPSADLALTRTLDFFASHVGSSADLPK